MRQLIVGNRSDRGDMALDLHVRRPFDLNLGPHPRTDSLDDRLVQYGHDLHVVQIREVEEVLFLPHGQTWLDNEGSIAIVRVNDEAVVRSADRAVFHLLLQQGEPIEMALEPELLATPKIVFACVTAPSSTRAVFGAVKFLKSA